MRPVERDRDPGGYAEYQQAFRLLAADIGEYCSYCEDTLKNGHVEHVLPKRPDAYPELALTWNNFLLACTNCNSTKGAWPTPADGGRAITYWPDVDNTARAFDYPARLPPRVSRDLPSGQAAMAQRLLTQTGVDRHPAHPDWSERDDRWRHRMVAWDKAFQARDDLVDTDTVAHRRTIANLAASTGFWSVWRAVFAKDSDMLRRLNDAFRGTAPCFDPVTSSAVARRRGRL